MTGRRSAKEKNLSPLYRHPQPPATAGYAMAKQEIYDAKGHVDIGRRPAVAVDGRERPLWVRERSVWEARKCRLLALGEGDRS
jgi:hypothetical protein